MLALAGNGGVYVASSTGSYDFPVKNRLLLHFHEHLTGQLRSAQESSGNDEGSP